MQRKIWRQVSFASALVVLCATARAEVQTNVEFAQADGESLKLDVSVPDGAGPFPAVIIVHGGGWRSGDKQFVGVKPLFEPLSQAGFAWFSINYRVVPKCHFPAPVEDVETAIRWVKAHAAEYKVDPHRIAMTGESAGAHLVAMAAVRATPETQVAAVVPFYGPFDLEALATERAAPAVLGLVGAEHLDDEARAKLRQASPQNFIRPGLPPFLLIHGTADGLVPFEQSARFCEKLKAAGGACEVFAVEGAGHGIGGWEKHPEFLAYKAKLVAWLKETLDKK